MTSADLVRTMADRLRDTKLVVVANRQPYVHEKQVTVRSGLRRFLGQSDKVRINWKQPASGLVTALDPVMQACGGTWVAHGNGSGDLEASDPSGRLAVPPDKPKYSLRRVWLKPQEENGYYYGVSNNALWPLCHIAYARPVFNQGDWRQVRGREPALCRRRARGDCRHPRDRVRAGLSLRAPAADGESGATRRRRVSVLAHPVAQSRGVPHHAVAVRGPRRASR